MAINLQSNPIYYSLSENGYSGSSSRTVELRKRPDQLSFGFYIGEDVPSGLYIITVERGSPAAEARIQPGDRVLAVNGQLISTLKDNPKQFLVKAASHTQSLTLTIQPTDIYQTLNLPLANSYSENRSYAFPQSQPTKKAHLNNDLESYIKSLFVNEDIQILPSSVSTRNNQDFTLTANPYASPRHRSKVSPRRHASSRSHDRRQHRSPRTRPKRIRMVTKETQTTAQDENMPEQQRPSSPPKSYPSSYPSMGTSRLILRANQSNPHDNEVSEPSKPKSQPAVAAREASSAASVKSSKMSANGQIPPSVTTVAAALPIAPIPATSRSIENNQPRPQAQSQQHMVDVVQAAMTAKTAQTQNSTTRQANPSPTSAAAATATAIAPAVTVPPKSELLPPPYKATPEKVTPAAPSVTTAFNDRPSANEGSYNVRSAQQERVAAKPAASDNGSNPSSVRRLRLVRQPNFQGYGFHLQYNKAYYLVQRVEPNSPAVNGGMRANDVVLSINNQATDKMPHATFVQIVNNNSQIDFTVQSLDDYLLANPQAARQPTASPAALTPKVNGDSDKPKNGLSRALGKLNSNS